MEKSTILMQTSGSSLIKEVKWEEILNQDNNSLGMLKVQFVNSENSIYEYEAVPYDVALALSEADSVGSYFAKNIKGKYNFKLIN